MEFEKRREGKGERVIMKGEEKQDKENNAGKMRIRRAMHQLRIRKRRGERNEGVEKTRQDRGIDGRNRNCVGEETW